MNFKGRKILGIIFMLCAILLTTGAYATWVYAGTPSENGESNLTIGLWRPNYPEEGQDQDALITTLLGETYGLNGNSNTLINTQMANRNNNNRVTLGNMGFFNTLFNSFDGLYESGGIAENVDFLIWYPEGLYDETSNPTATTYYIFTWEVKERNTGFLNSGSARILEGVDGSDITINDVDMDTANDVPRTPYSWVNKVYCTEVALLDGTWQEMKVTQGVAPASLYKGDWGNGYWTSQLAIAPDLWQPVGTA